MKRLRRDPFERFIQYVDDHTEDDSCWLWMGATGRGGYGYFQREPTRTVRAHRYALELVLGRPIGPGLIACHHCDNPPCVRPDHLYEGTYQRNAQDTVARRRSPKVRQTHCLRGHPLSGDNLVAGRKRRECRTCAGDRERARQRAVCPGSDEHRRRDASAPRTTQ